MDLGSSRQSSGSVHISARMEDGDQCGFIGPHRHSPCLPVVVHQSYEQLNRASEVSISSKSVDEASPGDDIINNHAFEEMGSGLEVAVQAQGVEHRIAGCQVWLRDFVERLAGLGGVAKLGVEPDDGAVDEVVEKKAAADGLGVDGAAGGEGEGGGSLEEGGECVVVGWGPEREHLGEEAEGGGGRVPAAEVGSYKAVVDEGGAGASLASWLGF